MRNPRVVESLIAALGDRREIVRIEATWALKKLTGEDFGSDRKRWIQWQRSQQPPSTIAPKHDRLSNYFEKQSAHVKRIFALLGIAGIMGFGIRQLLLPDTFGTIGHYRAESLKDILKLKQIYQGKELCSCHDNQYS
jgi:hypothetical protein